MNVLLVEDDRWLGDMYTEALERQDGFTVHGASGAMEALDVLDNKDIDCIVLDMFLGEHNGMALLHELISYEDTNTIPVVILSAINERDFAMSRDRWQQYGVVEYLYKPQTTPKKLCAALQKLATRTGA